MRDIYTHTVSIQRQYLPVHTHSVCKQDLLVWLPQPFAALHLVRLLAAEHKLAPAVHTLQSVNILFIN